MHKYFSRITKVQESEWLYRAILLLVGFAVIPLLIDFVIRLWLEVRGIEILDESVYWAMGRGILNGLTPYKDMYDEKPPGIFLIAAMSLSAGGRTLGHILQASALAGIAFVPALWTFASSRKITVRSTILLSILLGSCVLLAHFSAINGGGFQTESFGAFFGTIYVMIIAKSKLSPLWKIPLAGIFLLCAIGMKEPYLLTLAAAAILLAKTPKNFLLEFLMPLIVAILLGVILMWAIGWIGPYISVYLRAMFSLRVESAGSTWFTHFNGENVARLASEFYQFNAPFSFLLITCTFYVATNDIAQMRSILGSMLRGISIFIAFYLVMVATFLGGDRVYEHHFLFIVPTFIALLVIFTQQLSKKTLLLRDFLVCVLFSLLLFAAYQTYTRGIEMRLESDRSWTQNSIVTAQKIDRMLDACGLERYLFLGKHGPMPYEFTTHSPLGPFFYQLGYFLNDALIQQIERSDIVISHPQTELDKYQEYADNYLQTHFSHKVWPCAEKYANVPGYDVLFRIKTVGGEG